MRLKAKFFLGTLGLIAFSVVAVGTITLTTQRQALRQEIEDQHQQLANRLGRICEESLYETKLIFLNYVEELKKERGFQAAFFVDSAGVAQMHSDLEKVGFEVSFAPGAGRSYEVPVRFSGKQVGKAILLIDQTHIDHFLNAALFQNIKRMGAISLIVLVVALFFAWAFSRAMIRPIEEVVSGMQAVSRGRLEPLEFDPRGDELGWMGQELNATILKLKELEQMKRDFASKVTHDLKSPLKATLGFVNLLLNENEAASQLEQREYLLTIQNESNRLLNLIDDLLTTARLESHGEDLDLRLFDLRNPVQELLNLYFPIAKESRVALVAEIPATPVYVLADRTKMVHIVDNLLSNAFKYTAQGSVWVRVEESKDRVSLVVADSGSGLPPADKEKIFDRYYRSPSNKAQAKGTGLGLFIVKSMVDLQGGKVSVTDRAGGGSEFRVTLPKPAPQASI